jgi:hypothetical protein
MLARIPVDPGEIHFVQGPTPVLAREARGVDLGEVAPRLAVEDEHVAVQERTGDAEGGVAPFEALGRGRQGAVGVTARFSPPSSSVTISWLGVDSSAPP